jgi:hypothetical protein
MAEGSKSLRHKRVRIVYSVSPQRNGWRFSALSFPLFRSVLSAFPLDSAMFYCELTALLPWFIAPPFAAEAATLIIERTGEPRRGAFK